MRARLWLDRAVTIALLLLSLATVALLVAIVQGRRAGEQVVMMQTGSMRPLIAPGDLVVVRPVPVGEIRIGDLITFREPTGSRLIVTHRVVGIEETDAGRAFTTRGDANPTDDPWTLRYVEATGWEVVRVVPQIGQLQAAVAHPAGRALVAAGIFALALAVLWPLFLPSRRALPPGAGQGAD